MKIPPLIPLVALGIAFSAATPSARAANTVLYFDDNGAGTGTGVQPGGDPVWDTTSSFWRLGSTSGALQTYINTAPSTITAFFGGTAGTVTLATDTTINVNTINFDINGYTIDGASGSQIALSVGSGASNNPPNITASTGTSTVNAVISGSGKLDKGGLGTLVLAGANTYTGNTGIRGGSLSVSHLGTFGSTSSNLGAWTTGAATVDFGAGGNAGTLLYTGAGETSSRAFNLIGGSGVIQNEGTGELHLTGGFSATVSGARSMTFSGSNGGSFGGNIVNGSATVSLIKAGQGTWTLSGAHTYTGTTSVSAGTLLLTGSISGTANNADHVSVAGTIGGTGSLNLASGRQLSVTGTLAPGDPGATVKTGVFHVTEAGASTTVAPDAGAGSLNLASGATLSIKLGSTAAGGSAANVGLNDAVNVTGTISLDGASILSGSLLSGFTAAPGDLFFILINDGSDAITGAFAGLEQGSLLTLTGAGGLTQDFNISYLADSTANGGLGSFLGGNDIALMAAIPEPSVAMVLLTGLGAMAFARRMRRRPENA